MKIDNLLNELNACEPAKKWAKGKDWEEIYSTCEKGDWLCWLFAETNPNDIQLLTLVKGHQANTVRHLMTHPASIAAVDAAISFGEGKIAKEELDKAKAAAYAAAAAAEEAKKNNLKQTAYIFRSFIPMEKFNIK